MNDRAAAGKTPIGVFDTSFVSHDSAWSNETEGDFADLARRNGWEVTKRGWPDFLCFKDGELIAVEVKPRTVKGKLKLPSRYQVLTMQILEAHGIKCYLSDGKTLERFNAETHAPEHRRAPRSRKKAA